MKHLMCAVLLAVVSSGCYRMGTLVDQEQVASFEKGRTSCAAITAALGTPTKSTYRDDGSLRQVIYAHLSMQMRPLTFLVGGADTEQTQWTFECDTAGVLLTYESTQGQVGQGPGLLSGSKP